uniref:Uncharacterized protein n=1 Tax=Rhizobium meliloti TaxID=382 RepID=A0A0D4DCT8_RHIML|nr:hypothetical protein [Sinorhizobium meliloti]
MPARRSSSEQNPCETGAGGCSVMKSPASRAAGGADRLTAHGVDNIAGCEDPAEVVIVGQISTLI